MVEDFQKIKGELKKLKEKKSKKIGLGKLEKKFTKRIANKKILKKSQATLTIKQREAPSVLGDPNRFFVGELGGDFL